VSAPVGQRPGQPESPWWFPLAVIGVALGSSVVAVALLGFLGWVVYAYTLVVVSIFIAGGLAVIVLRLALKRDWRTKLAALALCVVLVGFVLWVGRR
jgi:hypothetical protein